MSERELSPAADVIDEAEKERAEVWREGITLEPLAPRLLRA